MVLSKAVIEALTVAYGAAGGITVASYAPQVRAVWRSRTGAADVSLLMWSLWSAAAVVAVLYAQMVAKDAGYLMVSLGNAVGCLAVTGVTLFKRAQYCGGAAGMVPATTATRATSGSAGAAPLEPAVAGVTAAPAAVQTRAWFARLRIPFRSATMARGSRRRGTAWNPPS